MLCAVIYAKTTQEAIEKCKNAKQLGADIAEIRLDFIKDPDLQKIISQRPLPLIITNRPKWEGGMFEGEEQKRYLSLIYATQLGAEYVDVEFKAYKSIEKRDSKIILSFHDFSSFTPNLEKIIDKMTHLEPDLIKIAVKVNSTYQLLNLLKIQNETIYPSIFIPLGEFGEPVRILYKKFGNLITYCYLDQITAEGQISINEFINTYHAEKINHSTKIYGIIGDPLGFTRSHKIYNEAFYKAGINAIFIKLKLDDINLLKKLMDTFTIEGLAVTIPHKQTVLRHLDWIDEVAKEIGAVNTIVKKNDRLCGYNTDWLGVYGPLKKVSEEQRSLLSNQKALVIGAGGAGCACIYALKKLGCSVFLHNRTKDRGKRVAGIFGIPYLEEIKDLGFKIIINATPVGSYPQIDTTPVKPEIFKNVQIVFDCVHNPPKTRFLKEAEAKGVHTISGMDMFLTQFTHQYQYLLGTSPPSDLAKSTQCAV
jgi:3-dehydroquinate dehydratase/shikimate dehydrogenase